MNGLCSIFHRVFKFLYNKVTRNLPSLLHFATGLQQCASVGFFDSHAVFGIIFQIYKELIYMLRCALEITKRKRSEKRTGN